MKKRKTPKEVGEEVISYVKKLPRKEIVKIGGEFLELFVWVDEVPMKPEGWDGMDDDTKLEFTSVITDKINSLVGAKATGRYWYVNVRGHSKKEFREWWKKRYIAEKKPEHAHSTLVSALVGYGIGSFLYDIIALIVAIIRTTRG